MKLTLSAFVAFLIVVSALALGIQAAKKGKQEGLARGFQNKVEAAKKATGVNGNQRHVTIIPEKGDEKNTVTLVIAGKADILGDLADYKEICEGTAFVVYYSPIPGGSGVDTP